jgi:hypothetical protein
LVLCLSLSSVLYAQRETGSIRGTVLDSEGSSLPGVTITATSPALQGTANTTSSATGGFRIPALPPGTYVIAAHLEGFKPIRREGIIVHVGMSVEVIINMEISTLAEEVTVRGASPVVDTVSSRITQTITSDAIQNLPVARNLWDLAQLAPGIVGPVLTSSSSMVVHGSANDQNTFKVDGVSLNDTSYNTPSVKVTYDVMEEIEMITGGLPAEIGTTSGAFCQRDHEIGRKYVLRRSVGLLYE